MSKSKPILRVHVLGDSKQPGSYTVINGNYLVNEGAFEVDSIDEFNQCCEQLQSMEGWEDCDFALVDVTEREIIAWY